MSDGQNAAELRRSLSLLSTEWWLPVGGALAYPLFGGWVVATGIAVTTLAPSLGSTAVGPTTGSVVFAAIVWLLLPAVAVAWLLDRRLSNNYGNLLSHYRINNPGVLVAPAGVLATLFPVVAVILGPRPPVVVFGLVAGTSLLVRTVAYGRRVYSFSSRPLFSLLTAVSGAALAAAWLVHAPRLPGAVGEQVGRAGVEPVAEAVTTALGTTPATALGLLVAVPAFLSGLYLVIQVAVSRRVRKQAPLADPDKRAEQRFPIMPPVPAGDRPGGMPSGPPSNTESESSGTTSGTDASSSNPPSTPTSASTSSSVSASTDDSSNTRVFTTDEPVPDEVPEVEAATNDDDGWIDDTSVFSPDNATDGATGSCDACGESLPGDASVTFCPNCGQQIPN